MNNNVPIPSVIATVRPLSADTSLFTLHTESHCPVARSFLPGQFLELSLPGVGEIPISYCGYPSKDGSIELCIRHVGHVTTPLKTLTSGDAIGVRGPFGNGFTLSSYVGRDLILVAGGLGIAPLRSLLLALLAERERYGRITLLFGARDAGSLLFLDELLEMRNSGGIELRLAVDHPGQGAEIPADCRVVLLPALLENLEIAPMKSCAAICGPPIAYPPLVSALQALGMPDDRIYLSLERRMKCGVGRCGHCAVGRYLCCVDGPIFSFAQLTGIEGALG